ncbi:MAG: hypothetical protein ACK5OX_04940 [Desertimonas sp.]
MVTFNEPATDAAEAREALRGLAHATRVIAEPGDTYAVLGSLSTGLASLGQSLDQLSDWHHRNVDRAVTDTGSRDAGGRAAVGAADNLHEAAALIEQARVAVDAAWNHNGRIAWHPEPVEVQTVRRLPEPSLFGAASVQRADNGLTR